MNRTLLLTFSLLCACLPVSRLSGQSFRNTVKLEPTQMIWQTGCLQYERKTANLRHGFQGGLLIRYQEPSLKRVTKRGVGLEFQYRYYPVLPIARQDSEPDADPGIFFAPILAVRRYDHLRHIPDPYSEIWMDARDPRLELGAGMILGICQPIADRGFIEFFGGFTWEDHILLGDFADFTGNLLQNMTYVRMRAGISFGYAF